jgi:hypothetical protein
VPSFRLITTIVILFKCHINKPLISTNRRTRESLLVKLSPANSAATPETIAPNAIVPTKAL